MKSEGETGTCKELVQDYILQRETGGREVEGE